MNIRIGRTSGGLLLILGGILLLLQNLSLLPDVAAIWAVLFAVVGLYFLVLFFGSRETWWAAFPAFGFLGIAGAIAVADLTDLEGEWAGAAFMAAISLGFYAIYLRSRSHWWPLIPGGVLASITGIIAVTALDSSPSATLVSTALFGGLALTFLVLYVAPSETGRARWAIWPSGVFLLIAGLTAVTAFDLVNFVAPVVLIVLGAAILLRSFRRVST